MFKKNLFFYILKIRIIGKDVGEIRFSKKLEIKKANS